MHQQKGVAEQIIRTIEGRLLAMLHLAGLLQTYWGEAAFTAAYLHNRTESRVLPPGQMPYEMLHGQCPNLSHLWVWGCRAFAHVPLELQDKLGPKSREVLFMGYPPGVKGYHVRDVKTGQFFTSHNVIFDENLGLPHLTGEAPAPTVADDEDDEESGSSASPAPATPPSSLSPASAPAPLPSSPLRRSSRSRNLTVAGRAFQESLVRARVRLAWRALPAPLALPEPASLELTSPPPASSLLSPLTPLLSSPEPMEQFVDTDTAFPLPDPVVNLVISEHAHLAIHSNTWRDLGSPGYDMSIPPATYDEAMHRPDADKWRTAMEKEMGLLCDMRVYDLVPLPPRAHAIGSRWVLEYKSGNGKGGPVEKACFMVKGFTQVPGCDFGRTFAPVACQSSIRIIAAHCAKEDWELHSLDIKQAFLHGKVEEDVYIRQPRGYEETGPSGEALIGKLNSLLYGIKQAAYEFYKILCKELEGQGFTRCEADHAIFSLHRDEIQCLLAWHVDDGMAGSNNDLFLSETKHCLHAWFGITDMGPITKYLGIQFECDRSTRELWIHQGEYILHILGKYGLSDCHPVVLPVDPNYPFLSDEAAATLPDIPDLTSLYPKLIRELLYLSVCTHLDIAHAVQRLSQYLAHPTPCLFAAAKCILRYLASTTNYRLHYGGATRTGELHGFSDADWATCPEDCVSITGYC